jgi:hypothetical protein
MDIRIHTRMTRSGGHPRGEVKISPAAEGYALATFEFRMKKSGDDALFEFYLRGGPYHSFQPAASPQVAAAPILPARAVICALLEFEAMQMKAALAVLYPSDESLAVLSRVGIRTLRTQPFEWTRTLRINLESQGIDEKNLSDHIDNVHRLGS